MATGSELGRNRLWGARSSFSKLEFLCLWVAALIAVALTMPVAAAVAAPKAVLDDFGFPNGTAGGQLLGAKGVAVNHATGDVYVVEQNVNPVNHRISQFDEEGNFIRAWGYDVVQAGKSGDAGTGFEICTVAADCKGGVGGPAAGQMNNPSGIAVDQSNGYLYVVDGNNRRIDVFSSVGQFAGAFGWDVADTGDPADTAPVNQLEICTTVCKAAAVAGADAGRFGNFVVSTPALDPVVPGRVYVPDPSNLRMTQYSTTISLGGVLAAATFDRAFGWDVANTGDPGDTAPVNQLEICTTVCKAGSSGNGIGQFTPNSPTAAAVDGTGSIYATSGPVLAGNCTAALPCRIQKFSSDASSAADFGPVAAPGQLTFTSGVVSNTVAAVNLAVDPVDDHVYVMRKGKDAGGETASSTSYQVHEYTSGGGYVETHPAGEALSAAATATTHTGIAVGTEERIYVNYGTVSQGRVFLLGPVPDPIPTAPSANAVGATTASFSGTVDIPAPGAPTFATKYHFEYSRNGIDWTGVPVPDQDVGNGSTGSHAVSATASGLEPNVNYLVRLAATTGGDHVFTTPVSFTTGTTSPSIARSYVEEVTETSAELGAHIDPQGLPTTYFFEWGPTAAYGGKVPLKPRQIGDGNQLVIVGEALSGLQPQASYHYRVVALSFCHPTGPGDVTPPTVPCESATPDQEFETLNECGLLEDRCYELVSPPDKGPVAAAGDFGAIGQRFQFQAAADGPALAYTIAFGLPDAPTGNEVLYQGDRGPSGWTSRTLDPPTYVVPGMGPPEAGGSQTAVPLGFSEDLDCSVFASNQPLTVDAPVATLEQGDSVLYARGERGLETVTATPPSNAPVQSFPGDYLFTGMAETGADRCERVVFRTEFHYPGVPGEGSWRSYEWDGDELRNVGVVPGPGGPEAAEALPGALPAFDGLATPGNSENVKNFRNAVSSDGSRTFFTAASRLGGDLGRYAVFVRELEGVAVGDLEVGSTLVQNLELEDGDLKPGQIVHGPGIAPSTTISAVDVDAGELTLSAPATRSGEEVRLEAFGVTDASQSQNPAVQNTDHSRFEVASRDGRYVFFTARRGLDPARESDGPSTCALSGAANGPGCSLYRYDVDTGALADLSVPEAGAANAQGPGVAGVLDASDDGSHVYFAARGQLVEGDGKSEAQNLADDTFTIYLWANGALEYVGSLTKADAATYALAASGMPSAEARFASRVTPDGSHLLYQSAADPADFTEGGLREAFLYSAEAESTVCVSCRRDGQDSIASPTFDPLATNGDISNRNRPPTTLVEADDGSVSVYFKSPNRLAVRAIEGRENLYQWTDGQIAFLGSSAPSASRELRFAGASRDGEDVYFTTVDQLTWQDTDGKLDVYDARIGGGFSQPPAPPAACDPLTEASCQGSGLAPPPAALVPATASLQGPGNAQANPTKPKKAKKKKRNKGQGKRKAKNKQNGGRRAGKNGRAGL